MAWVKRNLYFLIGGTIAVVLMGLAGWYLYSKWSLNNDKLEALKAEYAALQTLSNQKPNPGEEGPGKVDNVKAATDQQTQLHDFIAKTATDYQRIARVPDVPKVTDQAFSAALSLSIDQLQRAASNSSVTLPAQYSFSFEAESKRISFDSHGLPPLSVQLGEVKAICDVLFAAKVNSLDGLRRERVSPDDASGSESDYLDQKSVTNGLAVVTPYELTFRCFSTELSSALAGFASSPYGFVVKTINVDHSPAPTAEEVAAAVQPVPAMIPQPTAPQPTFSAEQQRREQAQRYAQRYSQPAQPLDRRYPVPPPVAPVPTPGVTAPAPNKGGLQTVLDEKQLRVTILLNIVKLLAPGSK